MAVAKKKKVVLKTYPRVMLGSKLVSEGSVGRTKHFTSQMIKQTDQSGIDEYHIHEDLGEMTIRKRRGDKLRGSSE